MSTPVANLKVKMDGEKEFRDALSSINSTFKLLDSEMTVIKAKYRDNMDSTEALTEVQGVLSRKLEEQKARVEELRTAVAQAQAVQAEATAEFERQTAGLDKGSAAYRALAAQLEKTKKQTENWQVQLNRAEAGLYDLNHELDENEKALKDAGGEAEDSAGLFDKLRQMFSGTEKETVGLGDALNGAAEKLGIQLPDSAAKALNSLNGISAAHAALVGGFAAVVSAIVKVEKKLISMTNEAADAAKELKTLSSVTGQSTTELQEFSYAADMIGVSSDRIRDSLKETTNKMQEARNGSDETALAYQNLGISITDADGNLRSATDVFYETIDALGSIQNQTERDALAMDLLSESAQELNPLIEIGSAGLQKFADEAHEMGTVLDDDAITALNNVDDAYTRLQKTQEGVQNQMAAEFSPYLTEFYGKVTKLVKDGGEAMERSGLVEAFGMLLDTFINIIAPTDQLSGDTVPRLTDALRPLAAVLALISDAMNVIAGLAKTIFPYFFEGNTWDNWVGGWEQVGTGLGMNKNQQSNLQQLWSKWDAQDTNRATDAAGYGAYYANGKYYGNKDAYLREEWEKALSSGGIVGSFEYWKSINGYATGSDYFYGGRTLVGENGPEEVILPRGTQITSASETRYGGAAGVYIDRIVIDAKNVKEFNDIIRIVQNARMSSRMEVK